MSGTVPPPERPHPESIRPESTRKSIHPPGAERASPDVTATDAPAEVVLRFLESVGRRSEAEYYVQLFRSEPKEQFAAISVDANVARHASEMVVLHLKFLATLGLAPVVVLGLLHPTDATEHAARIVRRLRREGVSAELFAPEPTVLDGAELIAACRRGVIPVLAFSPAISQVVSSPNAPAVAAAAGAGTDERFASFGGLLARLGTRKVIFLHRPGGLRQHGALLPIVNLTKDFAALSQSKELSSKERMLLAHTRALVAAAPQRLVVTITSPLNLLRELFTVKGAGTLLRKGASIVRHEGFGSLDVPRLRALVQQSFGRAPHDAFFTRPVLRVYLEEDYRGCAVLAPGPGAAYLTKFATDPEARGEGIARDLWESFYEDFPSVFWRARASNPVNEWYTKLCDGMMRFPEWCVFWKGVAVERVPELVCFALAQPVDLPAPVRDAPAARP